MIKNNLNAFAKVSIVFCALCLPTPVRASNPWFIKTIYNSCPTPTATWPPSPLTYGNLDIIFNYDGGQKEFITIKPGNNHSFAEFYITSIDIHFCGQQDGAVDRDFKIYNTDFKNWSSFEYKIEAVKESGVIHAIDDWHR